jgi:hypothetical protein
MNTHRAATTSEKLDEFGQSIDELIRKREVVVMPPQTSEAMADECSNQSPMSVTACFEIKRWLLKRVSSKKLTGIKEL